MLALTQGHIHSSLHTQTFCFSWSHNKKILGFKLFCHTMSLSILCRIKKSKFIFTFIHKERPWIHKYFITSRMQNFCLFDRRIFQGNKPLQLWKKQYWFENCENCHSNQTGLAHLNVRLSSGRAQIEMCWWRLINSVAIFFKFFFKFCNFLSTFFVIGY